MGLFDWLTNNPVALGYGQGDVNLGGNHLVDIRTPFHTPITALASGTITQIGYKPWGGQLTYKLDQPINGVPYAFYIHLDQLNPNLAVGQHINAGDLIGLSGGQNTGGYSPEASTWSSQPQTGFGLSNGPVFGVGNGWNTNPLGFPQLDPTSYLMNLKNGGTPNNTQGATNNSPFSLSGGGQKIGLFLIGLTIFILGFYLLLSKQINKAAKVAVKAAVLA